MYTAILELEEKLDQLLPNVGVHQHEEGRYNLMVEASKTWSSAIWDAVQQSEPLSFNQEQIAQGLHFSKSAVFICGVHRSGTTLLRNLLDHHPSLSVLPAEGTFITNQEKQLLDLNPNERCAFLCKEWLQRLVNSNNQSPFWLLGRSTPEQSSYIEFARIFKTWWAIFEKNEHKNSFWPLMVVQLSYATSQNKNISQSFWVDKTPTNERYLERLWKEFPNAKMIHVIRNPIDVILSRKRINKNMPTKVFVKDLLMSYRVAQDMSQKNDKRYILIRYEDLCETPELITSQLAEFIGIENSISLLVSTVAGKEAKANSSFQQEAGAGKIISKKENTKKETLTKEDEELVSAVIGKSVSSFGYQLSSVGSLRSLWLKCINRLF